MNKELPNDLSIEVAVLGAIINNPNKYNDVSKYIISDDVWYDGRCRILWNILNTMTKKR